MTIADTLGTPLTSYLFPLLYAAGPEGPKDGPKGPKPGPDGPKGPDGPRPDGPKPDGPKPDGLKPEGPKPANIALAAARAYQQRRAAAFKREL